MVLTQEKIELYKLATHERWEHEKKELSRQYQHAWSLARQLAALLKQEYHVHQVAVFGSLIHESLFHSRSDLDLAVWGLDEERYYRAVSKLSTLNPEIKVELIRIEDSNDSLRAIIEQEGIIL